MPHLLRRNGGCLSGDRLAALYDQDAGHASQKLALLSGTSAHDCPTGPVGAILIAVAERATAKSVPSTPIQRVSRGAPIPGRQLMDLALRGVGNA
jgi:hypothetical protein